MSRSSYRRKGKAARTHLRRDNHAIGGPYEELPVLMIVTLSIVVFLVATNNAVSLYYNQKRDRDIQEFTDSLSNSILSYQPLLQSKGQNGLFSSGKLINLNVSKMVHDLGVWDRGYGFNLTFWDTSGLPSSNDNNVSYQYDGPAPRGTTFARSWVVGIWMRENEVHSARMFVLAWPSGG